SVSTLFPYTTLFRSDSETEQLIQYAMDVVSKDRTTFIIAHRLSTIQHADQIILLENGEIKEQGNHQELIALGQNYSRMYAMQMRSEEHTSELQSRFD